MLIQELKEILKGQAHIFQETYFESSEIQQLTMMYPFPFRIIKGIIFFHDLSYFLKHKQDTFFLFLVCKTLRAIVTLFFSNFFHSSFLDGKPIPSYLYLFIKGLSFVIASEFSSCFLINKAYWKHLLSFLMM